MRMRFRSGSYGLPLAWMGMAVVQILTSVDRTHRHINAHRTGWEVLDMVGIVLWIVILFFYLHLLFGNQIELGDAILRVRRLWHWRTIRYDAIVAIRPAFTDAGKPLRKAIELEIAQLEAHVYPHEYLVLCAAKSGEFARALHERVPQAEYELA